MSNVQASATAEEKDKRTKQIHSDLMPAINDIAKVSAKFGICVSIVIVDEGNKFTCVNVGVQNVLMQRIYELTECVALHGDDPRQYLLSVVMQAYTTGYGDLLKQLVLNMDSISRQSTNNNPS